MQNEHSETLSDVLCDVLINYAFMFGDVCPKDELPLNGNSYVHVTVSFNGDRSGILGMSASSDFCTQLAINVLGVEVEDEDFTVEPIDALAELLNIVCGQFLTTVYGDAPVFDLSPPSILEIGEGEWRDLIENKQSVSIMIDDMPAIVYASPKST